MTNTASPRKIRVVKSKESCITDPIVAVARHACSRGLPRIPPLRPLLERCARIEPENSKDPAHERRARPTRSPCIWGCPRAVSRQGGAMPEASGSRADRRLRRRLRFLDRIDAPADRLLPPLVLSGVAHRVSALCSRPRPCDDQTIRRAVDRRGGPVDPAKEDEIAMADTPAPNGNGAAPAEDQSPAINALAQYAKDLSFENPNAPRSLQPQGKRPADQYPGQRQRQAVGRGRFRGRADPGRRCKDQQRGAVRLRAELCRHLPHAQHPPGPAASGRDDRVPAPSLPVRAPDHRRGRAQRRFPASLYRSDRFRGVSTARRPSRAQNQQGNTPTGPLAS